MNAAADERDGWRRRRLMNAAADDPAGCAPGPEGFGRIGLG